MADGVRTPGRAQLSPGVPTHPALSGYPVLPGRTGNGSRDLEPPEVPLVPLEHLHVDVRAVVLTPWPAAESGYIDEVIPPNETRARLISALNT